CYFPAFSLGVADYDGDGEADDFAIGQGQTINPNFGNFMTYQFFGIEDDGDVTKYHTSTENGTSISTPPGDFSPVPNEKDGYSPILKAENGEVTYIGLGAADSGSGTAGETTTRIIRMVPVADLPDEHSEKQGDSLERKLYELTNQVYEFVPDRGVKEELANHGVWHTGIYMDESGQKLRSYSLANSEDYDKVTLRLDFTFDVDGNLVDYVSKDYGFIEGLDAAENTEDPLHGIKRFADMFLDFYVVDGEKAVTLAEEDEDLESLLADEETEERRILWLWEEGLPKKYEGLGYAYYSDGYNHHYLVDKKHDMLLRFESPESFGGGRISGDNKTDLWKSGILAKDATIDLGESKLYTKEDRMAAVQVIVEEFKNLFTDCEIKELSYTSDECNCGENLRWMNQFAEGYEEYEEFADGKKPVFTQCIEFKGCYHSNTHGDGSLDIGDYPDWRWWLARERNGEWHLMTQGY
ncbi:MAG: hypothetical protein IJ733_01870, partial [Lachnospiraceae bacterium]|nr:hypothetical protein [Lachnospiraceae bacterium]